MVPQPRSLVGPSESRRLRGAFPRFSGPTYGLPDAPSHSSFSLLSQTVPVLLRPGSIYRNTNTTLSAAASRPEHCTGSLCAGRGPPAPQPCYPVPWPPAALTSAPDPLASWPPLQPRPGSAPLPQRWLCCAFSPVTRLLPAAPANMLPAYSELSSK